MMSLFDLIYALVTGLALIAGFVIEWRRGGNFDGRLTALEQQDLNVRLGLLEAVHDHNLLSRLAALEATQERMRRAV